MWNPISYRFIVRPDPVEKTTKSGIVIATDEKLERGATTVGTIIAIGEDAFVAYKPKKEFAGLKVGDRVAYAKYSGAWLQSLTEPKGEEVLALNDGDLIAVWVPDASETDVAA